MWKEESKNLKSGCSYDGKNEPSCSLNGWWGNQISKTKMISQSRSSYTSISSILELPHPILLLLSSILWCSRQALLCRAFELSWMPLGRFCIMHRLLNIMDSPGIFPPRVEHFAVSTPSSPRNSSHIPRKSSWGTLIPPLGQKSKNLSKEGVFDTIELSTSIFDEDEHWNTLDNITALGLSFHGDESPVSQKRTERFSMDDVNEALDESLRPDGDRPFNKWMKTLQKRGANRRQTMSSDIDRKALQLEFFESPGTRRRSSHKKSSSSSSFGFVTAMKSASVYSFISLWAVTYFVCRYQSRKFQHCSSIQTHRCLLPPPADG